GARAPSRQRRTNTLPTGWTPVRRCCQGPFTLCPAGRVGRTGARRDEQGFGRGACCGSGDASAAISWPALSVTYFRSKYRLLTYTAIGRIVTEANPSAEPPAGRIVIVMPTYNERQNLESVAGRVRAALPEADLLLVDDNSPA